MSVEDSSRAGANCHATLLTPCSRGAVATINVEGRQSVELIGRYFQPLVNRAIGDFPVGRIFVGHWNRPDGAAEEVVVCRRSESCFEVNCHGGEAASETIIESLVAAGAGRLSTEAWLELQPLDSIQRAAWLALRQANTARVAGILLDQFRGALKQAIQEVDELIDKGQDDYPDSLRLAEQKLTRLLALSFVGLHLVKPWRVVLAGPPNVGKSSLLNAILGYERAIVFDLPGTTRDVLAAITAWDGWPLEFIDTAGMRESSDYVESRGIELARFQLSSADMVILVTDATTDDRAIEQIDLSPSNTLFVANKSDLLSATFEQHLSGRIYTSAITRDGLEELMGAIVERLIPVAPQRGEAVPFTVEQVEQVEQLRGKLAAIRGRSG